MGKRTTGSMAIVTLAERPLLVLVSGAPGSGKSTLARRLSEATRLPHLDRDEIWAGLRLTHRRGGPDALLSRGVVAQFGALEHLLAVGVSLIADGTLYRGEHEASVRRLRDLAEVVNLHVRSDRAAQRFEERERSVDQPREELDSALRRMSSVQRLVTEPLDLSCRMIEVVNDDDFDPSVEQLVRELA